jgi:hypothetical protein
MGTLPVSIYNFWLTKVIWLFYILLRCKCNRFTESSQRGRILLNAMTKISAL